MNERIIHRGQHGGWARDGIWWGYLGASALPSASYGFVAAVWKGIETEALPISLPNRRLSCPGTRHGNTEALHIQVSHNQALNCSL